MHQKIFKYVTKCKANLNNSDKKDKMNTTVMI